MFYLLTHPKDLLAVILVVAFAVSFLYLALTKWKVWEYLQVHADGWWYRLTGRRTEYWNEKFSCVFCCSFWLGVIICLPFLIATGDLSWIIVPPSIVPLVRRLG